MHTIGFRITRSVPASEETLQYVDDFCLDGSCLDESCLANGDRSTAPPILNANDFQCFLSAFAHGCS